jgi:hypothetical protein
VDGSRFVTAASRTLTVATGLLVNQRGAHPSLPDGQLQVVEVGPLILPGTSPTEACTAEGSVWRRLWTTVDRLVIDFVGICTVEVQEPAGSVRFDRPLAGDVEQHLLLDHVLPLVLAHRGHLVLHGSVMTWQEQAVVVLGRSGSGKSTLAAFGWQRGWTVGGDDGAVVHVGRPPTVEPTYPTIRLTPHAGALLGIDLQHADDVAGKRRLGSVGDRAFRQQPTPLALVVALEPVAGNQPAELIRLRGAGAHAAMFAYTFHLDLTEADALGTAIERLARLAGSIPVARLRVPRGRDGLGFAEDLLRRELGG